MHTLPAFALFLAFTLQSSLAAQNPNLTAAGLIEGTVATLEVSQCQAGDVIRMAASLHGAGPIQTPFGLVDLTPPLMNFPDVVADSSGIARLSSAVPMGAAGVSIWFHAANLNSGLLSNSLAEVITANQPLSEIVAIPAGSFSMGDHAGTGQAHELPLHGVSLHGFWMDRFETKNTAYLAYLNAAYAAGEITVVGHEVLQVGGAALVLAHVQAVGSFTPITWNGTTFGIIAGKENHPVVRVNWYGACVYANWRSAQENLNPCYNLNTYACDFNANGYRLPTEAEWEYAARGGTSSYSQYHWGNAVDGSHANYLDSGDPFDNGTTPTGYYDGTQTPSGANMVNAFGLYDMSGNVWEWCHDWYDASYYGTSPTGNPTGPATGTRRMLRGGRWHGQADHMRSANRYNGDPINCISTFGFRLVSTH